MSCIRIEAIALLILLIFSASSQARPQSVYDLGISTGTYNQQNYTEIHGGLTLQFLDQLAWRNTVFIRSGETSSTAGLDTSARFLYEIGDQRSLGLSTYLGPGYRFTRRELSGPFVEGGAMIRNSGFGLGVGLKSLFYHSPTRYENGDEAPKNETILMIILGIGGGF